MSETMQQVLITKVFDAPRELVWAAWTDPGFRGVPHGSPQRRASDPHSGPRRPERLEAAFVAALGHEAGLDRALSTAEPLLVLLRSGKYGEPEIFFHWG